MNKIIGAVKAAAMWRRVMAFILTSACMLSALMTGTMAWADLSQHKTNIGTGGGTPMPGNVILQKYERDRDGNETVLPVPGVEFTLYMISADGSAVRVSSFTTGADGQIKASDLMPGSYYWQETRPAPGFLPETENGQTKKYPFTIPGEEEEQAYTIAYNSRWPGRLAIVKTVHNADDSALTQEQQDMPFAFTVTFSDGGNYTCSIDGGPVQTVASGGKIYLKSGQTALFNDIPAGLHYEVIETPAAGYTTRSENHAGHVPEDGVTVAFINTCGKPNDHTGRLTVTKTVTGAVADLDRQFPFTAVIGSQSETFTLAHGQSKTFDDIPFGTAYAVSEADPSADGYTAATQDYSGVITAGNNAVTLPFINHYDEDGGSKNGDLTVTKAVVGKDADPNRDFTFVITFTGEGAPESPQTFTLRHGQSKTFTDVPQGVTYTVSEKEADGYDPNYSTVSGMIAGDQTVTVDFVNHKPDITEPGDVTLTVTKRVEGPAPASDGDKLFHFILTVNGIPREFDLKPGETKAFILSTGDVYSLAEADYTADGYVRSGLIGGTGMVGERDIAVIQINTYIGAETIDIEGEKTWNMAWVPVGTQLPASITVRLINGDVIVATQTVTPGVDGKWRYAFNNLPKHDALGREIVYGVEEARLPGWRPVISGYDIQNVYLPPVVADSVVVEKALTGETPPMDETFRFVLTPLNGAPMPPGGQVTIIGAGTASFGSITYTAPGTYTYTVAEVDGGVGGWVYDTAVYTLTVTVTEEDGQLKVSRLLAKNGAAAEKALFTNLYDSSGETVCVRVTKVWWDEGRNRPESVQVQLYKDGSVYGRPFALSAANNWTSVWNGLDKNAVWTVDEVTVPEGYTKVISGDRVNGFVITNIKDCTEEQTSVKVTKVWKGEDENCPQSIAAQLYKDGAAFGLPVTLTAANGWTYIWTLLEKGPVWTADELNVPLGYSKAISGDAANGFVITNTKRDIPVADEITVAGRKTWNHGDNPENNRPASITVIIKANGVIVSQRQITAADDWRWNFTLPKFDGDGNTIRYTVDEAQVGGYVKTVDGYNLINTCWTDELDDPKIPGVPMEPGIPGGPATGDNSSIWLWAVLMIVSAAALRILLLYPGSKKNKRKLT